MQMVITNVTEEGIEIEFDDEAEAAMQKLAISKLGEDSSIEDREMYIKSVIVEAIEKAHEDMKLESLSVKNEN